MRSLHRRGETARRAVVMSMVLILGLASAATAAGASQGRSADRPLSAARAAATGPAVDLWAVGARKVRKPIPIRGRVRQTAGTHKLVLQRQVAGGNPWTTVVSKQVGNGTYRFAPQRRRAPGAVSFRTVLFAQDRAVAVSNVVTVRVVSKRRWKCVSSPSPANCAKPRSLQQRRAVVYAPNCQRLTVTTRTQTRTVVWRWSTASKRWVPVPTPWVTGSTSTRAARAAECLKVVSQVPAGAALPDLRIRDLTDCSGRDLEVTGGTCFMIVTASGKKLLKFGMTTSNVGTGLAEIMADRSAANASNWRAYQNYYDANRRLLGSVVTPNAQFYFAGDGHDHWHVRDFDEYTLLDADGDTVAVAEKHGYCMWDNNQYAPMQGQPGVSPAPVYTAATSCGRGLPNALSIVQGLSPGWGDTYPTALADQAIDISAIADGEYTVRVHADAVGATKESNESNNVAQVRVQISDETVTVVPGSSTGGL